MYFANVNDTTLKQGDTKRTFQAFLFDNTNTPIDLTNATVRFYLANKNGVLIDKTVSVVNATNGEISFGFDEEDLTGNGILDGEFKLIYADGTFTVPTHGYVKFRINQQLPDRGSETITPGLYQQVVEVQAEQDAKINEIYANGIDPDSKKAIDDNTIMRIMSC